MKQRVKCLNCGKVRTMEGVMLPEGRRIWKFIGKPCCDNPVLREIKTKRKGA